LSLSNIAPTEKTEHLIYSILPIAIATYIASYLVTNDSVTILVTVISLSSFLSLFLFEFTPEKPILDEFLRRKTRSRKSLEDALLVFSLMFKVWRHEVIDVSETGDYLEELARTQVNIAVAGPHIGKKTWRIRASIYLFFSVPFLFQAFWNYLHKFYDPLSTIISVLPSHARIVLDTLHSHMFIIILITMICIVVEVCIRHRKLLSHIDHLSRYDYLTRSLTIQRLQNPDYFRESSNLEGEKDEIGLQRISYRTLIAEMELLRELLLVQDWSGFFNAWDRLYLWICKQTASHKSYYWAYYLLKPIADLNHTLRRVENGEPISLVGTLDTTQEDIKKVCYFLNKVKTSRQTTPTVDIPKVDADLDKILIEVYSWLTDPIKLDEPTRTLLGLAEEFPVIQTHGFATTIMWALAWRYQDNLSFGGQGGVRYLFQIANDTDENEDTRKLAADVALRAFEDGGVGPRWGFFFELDELLPLKDLVDSVRRKAWHNALAHFIEEKGLDYLNLHRYEWLEEEISESMRVRDAFLKSIPKDLDIDDKTPIADLLGKIEKSNFRK